MFTIIIILITHYLQAVEIIKKKYHGKYHVILLCDHARAHTAKPPDSLNAATMNVGSGGKQPLQRAGYYKNAEGDIVKQSMVFEDGDKKEMAKGLRIVAKERFGTEAVKGNYS